jgi:hypothetical protein
MLASGRDAGARRDDAALGRRRLDRTRPYGVPMPLADAIAVPAMLGHNGGGGFA